MNRSLAIPTTVLLIMSPRVLFVKVDTALTIAINPNTPSLTMMYIIRHSKMAAFYNTGEAISELSSFLLTSHTNLKIMELLPAGYHMDGSVLLFEYPCWRQF